MNSLMDKVSSFINSLGSVIIQQWVIIVLIAIVLWLLTRNLKVIPESKKQNIVEMGIEGFSNWVKSTMGDSYIGYAPFVGSLAIFVFVMNVTDLLGFKPPTSDFSVALALSLLTFLIVQINSIRENGLFGYLKGYGHPTAALLPINILERVMLPVTLSFRLFGNITVAVVIMELVYQALGNVAWIAQLAIPVPLMGYFDLFDGVLQSFIFTILTMINIKMIAEE
ncbi:MAG: F0F1 ATP synthase subunit A [Clostridium sp.]|uniref:F0F1 ATP synthase subunit A n=1 Tax=Clostridium TaxID=1485 RepID=UPI0021531475|nr:F0F1 ATP synthase subunit A [Clostridium sp. LY3-2]MCR6516391.1 F0F1 ATP synthase subunit A [Clostridium sp. LY3-2]